MTARRAPGAPSPPAEPDFRLLFESCPGLYLVLTPDLRIVAASDAYLHATMTRREDVLGRLLFDVFPDNPDDADATGVRNLRASLDTVRRDLRADTMPFQKYDIRRPASEGAAFEERHWSPQNSPVFGPDGSLSYIIHRVEDVTEFVQMGRRDAESRLVVDALRTRTAEMELEAFRNSEQVAEANHRLKLANGELARAAAGLAEANRELEAFSYSVSHDLRAPLRSIAGFGDALLRDAGERLDAPAADHLRRILAAAERMDRLIDGFLRLATVASAPLVTERCDLSAMARAVAADLVRSAPDRGVVLDIEEGLTADGDPHLLRTVVENLMGNAWKFTSKAASARIEVFCERGVADASGGTDPVPVFCVRDDGPGYDPSHAARIFGPFQRLHSPREYPGTGIGLATVQRIVHRHGGTVWAESSPGRGVTVRFTLAPPPGAR